MNFGVLKTLINSLPANAAKSDDDVALWCNTPTVIRRVNSLVTTRTMMNSLGPFVAESILNKLELVASQNAVLARTLNMMKPSEGGIDFSGDATRGQIDALVDAEVLTVIEGNTLKTMGEEIVSPAVSVSLGQISRQHVAYARTI